MNDRKKQRLKSLLAIAAVLIVMAVICIVAWEPIVQVANDPESFRAWIESHGAWGKICFVGLVVLQIIVAVIPGEPLEIAAGYAFGSLMGTILCVIGSFIGGTLVFLAVRKWGFRVIDPFISREKILSFRLFQNKRRLTFLAFVLFLIPGTPKDVMTYAAGLTGMKLPVWLLITSAARLPSILTSTISGDALGLQEYSIAIIVFCITTALSIAGFFFYRYWNNRHTQE